MMVIDMFQKGLCLKKGLTLREDCDKICRCVELHLQPHRKGFKRFILP